MRRDFGDYLNVLALAGVSAVLLLAFYYQLVLHELPCPLCLLQRGCLIAVGIGFVLNVRFGVSPAHYALVLLGAVLGTVTSGRQILLHIVPGTGAYGSALFGMHFYTWAFVAFAAVIVFTTLLLFLPTHASGGDARVRSGKAPLAVADWVAVGLFLFVVAANLASTLLECGFGQCADNPVSYQWLGK